MTALADIPSFGDDVSLRKRFAPVAIIFALHGVMFWAAASGMLSNAVRAVVPQAVMVTFVSTPSKPTQPEAPKPVNLTPPPPSVSVPLPVIQVAQAENAISIPQQPPAAVVERSQPVSNAAPAAAPGTPVLPKLVTSGVEYVKPLQVVYSPVSRRMGEQGKVILRVLVNDRGQPERILVESSSGFPRLDESGRQAAMRALFKPYMENGRPIPVEVLVPVNFQLG